MNHSYGTITSDESKLRCWNKHFKRYAIRLLPGECKIAKPNEMLVTILGSCVCACIRDKYTGLGGMNHFLLAHDFKSPPLKHDIAKDYSDKSTRYGTVAMEVLINELLKHGAQRANLEAKIFGGSSISSGLNKIGSTNIEFVKEYLALENIPLINSDVGGTQARTVYFLPDTGDVFVRKVERSEVLDQEIQYKEDLDKTDTDGEVYFLD